MGKKTKPRIPKIPTGNDGPTPERLKHDGGAQVETISRNLRGEATQMRFRAMSSSKLDWLYLRGSITEQMHRAGSRFSYLFFCAGKLPKTTVMYRELIGRSNSGDPTVEYTFAQKMVKISMEALSQDERDVVWTVCGQDGNLIKRADIRHLQTGLRALSMLYGMNDYRIGTPDEQKKMQS